LLPTLAFSQLADNFNDGDITNEIQWIGNTSNFRVNTNNQLQLYSEGEGHSYLSTLVETNDFNEWNFFIKLSFSPSNNNQCLVYLVCDSTNPEVSTDAFYLKFGKSGSDDAIELYRKTDTISTLVASGTPGFISESFSIRVKITREDGSWQIWADSTGGSNFSFQAQGNEDHWGTYQCFSILCRHTLSNSTKFYFDDIYAGPPVIDVMPPWLTDLTVTGTSSIDLTFSEEITAASSAEFSNYLLLPLNVLPVAAGTDLENRKTVHLLFEKDFTDGTQYTLKIRGIKDAAGNRIKDTLVQFFYHQLKAFDVIINEIMADPDPPVALSGMEYLELYNRTPFEIKLNDWCLNIGSIRKPIPIATIEPSGYLIVAENDTLMSIYGDAVQIQGLELSNSGNLVSFTDENGHVIHAVHYGETWYKDPFRETGGWSLEMIDPNNPCGGENNWKASTDPSGGTPGRINSVSDSNTDNENPYISFLSFPDSSSITIHFSEVMDSISISDYLAYSVTDESLNEFHPINFSLESPEFEAVTLTFQQEFIKDVHYTLYVQDTVTDCCNNSLDKGSAFNFMMPYIDISTGVILNEILFNPSVNGEEFIEIYNRTDSAFNLKKLMIASVEEISGEIKNAYQVSESPRLFMPHSYLVLTPDPLVVQSQYYTQDLRSFIKTDKFPSLSNSSGKIALITESGTYVDQLIYSDDMHFDLLRETKGVSLERVNPVLPSENPSNWHSASQSCGFATPGYRNSQYMLTESVNNDAFIIEPKSFSPDNDGFNDQLSMVYRPLKPGELLTIKIFDSNGKEVKLIAGNYLTGSENTFLWDGITDNGTKATAGIYIIYVETLDLSGNINKYKKTAVVASR